MGSFRYSTALVIPQDSSVKDPVIAQELTYAFNALRTLAVSLDTLTGALSPPPATWSDIDPVLSILGNQTNKFYAYCPGAIAYGAMVNFYNLDPTHVQARPAQANVYTNAAAGFCVASAGVAAGQYGEFVVGPGVNYGISGMVPGTWYYLDPVSLIGAVTAVQPVVPGQIIQICGVALTDTRLLVGSLNNWRII